MRFSEYEAINTDIHNRVMKLARYAESIAGVRDIYVFSETRIGHMSAGDKITLVVSVDKSFEDFEACSLRDFTGCINCNLSLRSYGTPLGDLDVEHCLRWNRRLQKWETCNGTP